MGGGCRGGEGGWFGCVNDEMGAVARRGCGEACVALSGLGFMAGTDPGLRCALHPGLPTCAASRLDARLIQILSVVSEGRRDPWCARSRSHDADEIDVLVMDDLCDYATSSRAVAIGRYMCNGSSGREAKPCLV